MRLIDADALKYRHKDYGGYDDVGDEARKRGILFLLKEDINSAPTINPARRKKWIPCSERLPDKAGRYLTTCSKWGAWKVDWNIWVTEQNPLWLWEQGVIAWMPMPEPYKEEEDV